MSKIPVWIITRQTFDERIRPLTLYYEGLLACEECWPHPHYTNIAWSANRDDSYHFFTKGAALDGLAAIYPRHGNEGIVEIEVESVKVV